MKFRCKSSWQSTEEGEIRDGGENVRTNVEVIRESIGGWIG